MTHERDDLLSDIVKLRQDLAAAASVQQKAESDLDHAQAKVAEVYYSKYYRLYILFNRIKFFTLQASQVLYPTNRSRIDLLQMYKYN